MLTTTTCRQFMLASRKSGRERRQRIAGIASHAMQRNHQSFARGIVMSQQRNRGRMPKIVTDADQARARQQRPVGVGEPHQQIRRSDPAERDRHQQSLARDRIDQNSARDVRERSADELAGQDRTDLAVAQSQLVTDQRQQQIERRRIPMGQHLAERDQPHIGKRPRSRPRDRRGNIERRHSRSVPPKAMRPIRRSRIATGAIEDATCCQGDLLSPWCGHAVSPDAGAGCAWPLATLTRR